MKALKIGVFSGHQPAVNAVDPKSVAKYEGTAYNYQCDIGDGVVSKGWEHLNDDDGSGKHAHDDGGLDELARRGVLSR